MITLSKDIRQVLEVGNPRDHIVLWHRTDAIRDAVMSEFIEAGAKNHEYIVIALCLGDFEALERAISKRLYSLDALIDGGDLVMFVSCEFLPRKDGAHKARARETFADLEGKAKNDRRGLRLLGTISFEILASGDEDGCLEMERIGRESLNRGRLLCLYDTKMLRNVGSGQMAKVNGTHTHVLVEGENRSVQLSARSPQSP